jgi:hypothetical protein
MSDKRRNEIANLKEMLLLCRGEEERLRGELASTPPRKVRIATLAELARAKQQMSTIARELTRLEAEYDREGRLCG